MTNEEEKLVLRWLRLRPKHPRHGLRERRMLQTAILNDELSREIRNAMADWLEDDPASLLPSHSFQAYDEFAPIDEKAWANLKPAPPSPFHNDVELGSWNYAKSALEE
jgi:hypothetical protein